MTSGLIPPSSVNEVKKELKINVVFINNANTRPYYDDSL